MSVSKAENLASLRVGVTKPCRVLVVDDDPLVRARLCVLLNAAQYQVDVATNGTEALGVLQKADCHIVLTDWEMPDMDGLELCRLVRLQMIERHIYIMMLTVRDTEPDFLAALATGADDYIVKGTPVDEMLSRMEIGRRASQGQSPRQLSDCEPSSMDRDPATGAYNLDYLLQNLPLEWARSRHYGQFLAVLICYFEGFDPCADRFGRESADERLSVFVRGAQSSIRKGDWLARTVPNSFMIVLPETAAAGAQCTAERLRALFREPPFAVPSEAIDFTVLVEVASVDGRHDAHGAALIDALLFAAFCGTNGDRGFADEHADRCDSASEDVFGGRRNDLN